MRPGAGDPATTPSAGHSAHRPEPVEPPAGEPRRVSVTSSRTRLAREALARGAPWKGAPGLGPTIARDIDEQTELGAVYVRSLMRAQLRAAAVTCGAVLVVVAGLPLLLVLLPWLGELRIFGMPLLWLVLAVCIQPIWVALAARHVRRAERIEREFVRLVERP